MTGALTDAVGILVPRRALSRRVFAGDIEGCDKKGSLQGKLPGTEKVAYFCCGSHMESSGATQTEKNKKQRKDCNAKMLLNRKRKQENGGEAGKRHMLLILW